MKKGQLEKKIFHFFPIYFLKAITHKKRSDQFFHEGDVFGDMQVWGHPEWVLCSLSPTSFKTFFSHAWEDSDITDRPPSPTEEALLSDRVKHEKKNPLITLYIAPRVMSLSAAYLYLYIVWLMCSKPGASE